MLIMGIDDMFLDDYVNINIGVEYFYDYSMTEVLLNFHDAIVNFVHDWNDPGRMKMWGVDCSYWYAWAIRNFSRPSQSYDTMEQLGQAFYDEFERMFVNV